MLTGPRFWVANAEGRENVAIAISKRRVQVAFVMVVRLLCFLKCNIAAASITADTEVTRVGWLYENYKTRCGFSESPTLVAPDTKGYISDWRLGVA